jgi:hypothetical protein
MNLKCVFCGREVPQETRQFVAQPPGLYVDLPVPIEEQPPEISLPEIDQDMREMFTNESIMEETPDGSEWTRSARDFAELILRTSTKFRGEPHDI